MNKSILRKKNQIFSFMMMTITLTIQKKIMKKNSQKRSLILNRFLIDLSSNQCPRIPMMKTLHGMIRKKRMVKIKKSKVNIKLMETEITEDTEATPGEGTGDLIMEIGDIEEETGVIEEEIEEDLEMKERSIKEETEMIKESSEEETETTRTTITKKKMNNDYFNFEDIFNPNFSCLLKNDHFQKMLI